jgi:hypothetical protein
MDDKLIVIGAAVAVLIVAVVITGKLFGKKKESNVFQSVSCTYCSWSGQVSRYAGRCPQCNEPLGDRAAKRRT